MSDCIFNRGDDIVVVKGRQRGRVGKVMDVGGTCAGEDAVEVILLGRRYHTVTFVPASHLVKVEAN